MKEPFNNSRFSSFESKRIVIFEKGQLLRRRKVAMFGDSENYSFSLIFIMHINVVVLSSSDYLTWIWNYQQLVPHIFALHGF